MRSLLSCGAEYVIKRLQLKVGTTELHLQKTRTSKRVILCTDQAARWMRTDVTWRKGQHNRPWLSERGNLHLHVQQWKRARSTCQTPRSRRTIWWVSLGPGRCQLQRLRRLRHSINNRVAATFAGPLLSSLRAICTVCEPADRNKANSCRFLLHPPAAVWSANKGWRAPNGRQAERRYELYCNVGTAQRK